MSALLTVTVLFLIAAIVTAITAASGKTPQWVSVILLCVVVALLVLPK